MTASGGPFLNTPAASLATVTVRDALMFTAPVPRLRSLEPVNAKSAPQVSGLLLESVIEKPEVLSIVPPLMMKVFKLKSGISSKMELSLDTNLIVESLLASVRTEAMGAPLLTLLHIFRFNECQTSR